MIDLQQLDRLPGMRVIGTDGADIGRVDEVYVDDPTGEPSFALIDPGMLGLRSSFVPLDRATIVDDALQVAATRAEVEAAPSVEAGGYLSPEGEDELYRYYGLQSPSDHQAGVSPNDEATAEPVVTGGSTGTSDHGPAAGDASRAADDDAMTLSEEELHVGIRNKTVGKVRLRKHVVTEYVTKTIPVQREVVTIEREPVDGTDGSDQADEADEARAAGGPAISEAEHEVTLYEEELVIEKRIVPKERVRLTKEVHTEEEIVEADVAKEELDLSGLEEARQEEGR